MLSLSAKKLKEVSIDDCVTIQIPEFDRGAADPANVIGIVLEKKKMENIEWARKEGQFPRGLRETLLSQLTFEA